MATKTDDPALDEAEEAASDSNAPAENEVLLSLLGARDPPKLHCMLL